jgi:hypothetical protein
LRASVGSTEASGSSLCGSLPWCTIVTIDSRPVTLQWFRILSALFAKFAKFPATPAGSGRDPNFANNANFADGFRRAD